MQNLKNIIDKNFIDVECEMKDVPNSFSSSNLIVIDFIKVKNQFCKEIDIGEKPASCNCLYFKISNDKLVFIVIKNFYQSLIENERINTFDVFKDKFYRKIGKSEYINRLDDSINLLHSIAKHFNINSNSYNKLCDRSKFSFYYCILVNISFDDYLTLRLSDLSHFEQNMQSNCAANISIIVDSYFDNYIAQI
jgi:hypothetical protein